MFTYFCPGCGSVETHAGSLLSQCKDWYGAWGRPVCKTWTIAIAWKDNQPMKGSQLNMIPDRVKP